MSYRILHIDPYLKPYEQDLNLRMAHYKQMHKTLLPDGGQLRDFANAHVYFGFHRTENGWVYREWAPAAENMYLTGDFCGWDIHAHRMNPIGNGVFELYLDGHDTLKPGQHVQAIVIHQGQTLRRIPLFATRVEQDPMDYTWCAVLEEPNYVFPWTDKGFRTPHTPFIYECHIGMAQDAYGVGSYDEFRKKILPRIKALGYNTIQLMAIMEHPYYGSFGYQVSNFYAASSRYGESVGLKKLIDTAHSMGIAVLLDVVHSHAVRNTAEGINEFDGTTYQFFHEGAKGDHSAWGTKLFNYAKPQVLHFLLSNLKYWMDEFHFDGFRFDGVTSMLYHDHGLGSAFTSYDMYFSMNTDIEAVTYLQLANELIHEIRPDAITVAEDMSGMPGMCIAIRDGGIGFDYRLAMGVPDLWIKLIKEVPDENWQMGHLWYELTSRRPREKNIGYSESHDQALVGDKTIMFRLCDANMYTGMSKFANDPVIDRGIALHKMIRILTASLAGEGYLNFMGNEFGHPEWIDFPREGNGWSYHYCRRQWSLVDTEHLRYGQLNRFDSAMVHFLQDEKILESPAQQTWCLEYDKVLMYRRGNTYFVFNFHPTQSFEGYFVPTHEEGMFRVVLSSDDSSFGGYDRVDQNYLYKAEKMPDGRIGFPCYLPSRTMFALQKVSD